MPQNNNQKHLNESKIKFVAPDALKQALQVLANERNISLSAFLRLIGSEYVKRHHKPSP